MTKRLTKEQANIISAYTGILCGEFSDLIEYASKVMGRPISRAEISDDKFYQDLKNATKYAFLNICYDEEESIREDAEHMAKVWKLNDQRNKEIKE